MSPPVYRVVILTIDGEQEVLTPDSAFWISVPEDIAARGVGLEDLGELFHDPEASIVFEKPTRWEEVAAEPWMRHEEWRRSRHTIYGRGVASVIVVYDEVMDGARSD